MNFKSLANFTSTYRSKQIVESYQPWLKPKSKVLDIGCGNGIVSQQLKSAFSLKLSGCDIDDYRLTSLPFKYIKNNNLPYHDKEFDYAMFNDVLHHMSYPTQVELIKEALRVAQHVLIFEVQPTFAGRFFDYLLNKIHHWNMPIPLTFRDQKEWQKLFKQLKQNNRTVILNRPTLYPFQHQAFILSSK